MRFELWASIISYWRGCGLPIREGAPVESIKVFEEKYHVALPSDFAEYLQAVDGTGSNGCDKNLFSFWSLSEIRPVHDVLGATHPHRFAYPNCFVFADWSINCWVYAIRVTSDTTFEGPVYRVGDSVISGRMEADSFLEFMMKYVTAPESVVS